MHEQRCKHANLVGDPLDWDGSDSIERCEEHAGDIKNPGGGGPGMLD